MNYIRVTVTAMIPVPDEQLSDYEATTIEEAAQNQQKWLDNRECGLMELLDGAAEVNTVLTGVTK